MQNEKLKNLQGKYPRFCYENYSWRILNNDLEISFDFRIEPEISFNPKIIIENVDKKQLTRIGERILNNFVFHLGLMEIPSYWKATCSPEILIKAGSLNREQIRWWEDLIMNGMGQFFYENRINFRNPSFLKIRVADDLCKKSTIVSFLHRSKSGEGIIVPVGGGKDSVVTLEILKKAEKEIRPFIVNPNKTTLGIIKIAQLKNPIVVRRKIDKTLLGPKKRGYLNGHTPFSAVLAFLSLFCAVIFDYKYIAFSNERSSNEGNVKYLGKEINHQWSKSFEFENKFRNYARKYLAKDVEYFSFLRPLYELQIAKLFLRYPKYFSVFLSCNNAYKSNAYKNDAYKNDAYKNDAYKNDAYKINPKTGKIFGEWCGNCPKCLFVFMALYPFLAGSQIIKIFGQNLLDKKELLPIMKGLIGEKKIKPFECVGTRNESLIALYLDVEKAKRAESVPFLLKYFQNKMFSPFMRPHGKCEHLALGEKARRLMNSWNNINNLPKGFEKTLKNSL